MGVSPVTTPAGRRCHTWVVLWSLILASIVAPALVVVGADDPVHFPVERPLDITHIKLNMRVDLKSKTVISRAKLDGVALRRLGTIRLDAVDFEVKKVSVQMGDASPADCDYENDGRHLSIDLPRPLQVGEHVSVTVEYKLTDPVNGLHFFAPSEEEPDAPLLVWSQGQSITNRYWVPCYDPPNENQTTEIWVRPFPNVEEGRWQVSIAGGSEPVWAPNGRELFYINNANELVSATVQTDSVFEVLDREILFRLPDGIRRSISVTTYDVRRDGSRFLMIRSAGSSAAESQARGLEGVVTRVILVENWFEELRRLVPR